MPENDTTPIRQQYLEIKKQYPDTILFFRLGDFYETFDKDAEITSRELDIVLTSRAVAKGNRVPMAGIPFHAAENYLARLLEHGYHVAICEQVGEQPVKGLYPRQVVRVITPGTLTEPGLLRNDRNNYLMAICIHEGKAGLAYTDISTGEFSCTEFAGPDISNLIYTEISRIEPSEVLISEKQIDTFSIQSRYTIIPDWQFAFMRCQKSLLRQFEVVTLDSFGLTEFHAAICASGVIIQYLQNTHTTALNMLRVIKTYSTENFMVLDSATRRNLEISETIRKGTREGSLLSIIDHTATPMGKRLITQWLNKPLLNISEICRRQEQVEYLVKESNIKAEVYQVLHSLCDVERIVNRIPTFSVSPRELIALRKTFETLPKISELIKIHSSPLDPIVNNINLFTDELNLLNRAITDEPPISIQSVGIIKHGYSDELDNLINTSKHAREWIANLESLERERTGIKTLKVGYNKIFGYFIEVTHSNSHAIPNDYIRKQTLVNAERYITPEMKEFESLILNADERIHELEIKLYKEICKEINKSRLQLLMTTNALAEIDTLCSLAETAMLGAYHRPEIVEELILEIIDGRHPVVENSLYGERFVPNDAIFETGEIIRLITGPNMSGKSTFLRQIALITILAQMGSFVPASSARIGIVDRIFTRIGAQDEIHTGQSTFMVEMIETANILNHATPKSLLVLDEIGRGTSTYDGLSIAWSVIEYIHNHPDLKARTFFATHYHELTQLSELLPGVHNYNVAVSESDGKVIFLHKIIPGGTDRSYGIHVAQLAGLPTSLIQRATEILKMLESSAGNAVNFNNIYPQQISLFPESNPLLDELKDLDINTLSPIEAINKLYEWKKKFSNS